MTQLRKGRKDLLRAGAPKLDRQLGPLPHAFARHDHALPELRMEDAHTHRARAAGTARRALRRPRVPARRYGARGLPRLRLLDLQAFGRDLGDEAGDPTAGGVPAPAI